MLLIPSNERETAISIFSAGETASSWKQIADGVCRASRSRFAAYTNADDRSFNGRKTTNGRSAEGVGRVGGG